MLVIQSSRHRSEQILARQGEVKGRVLIFLKRFIKLSRGRVPKQTCSQSAVRGVSTRDVEERAFNEQPSRATER